MHGTRHLPRLLVFVSVLWLALSALGGGAPRPEVARGDEPSASPAPLSDFLAPGPLTRGRELLRGMTVSCPRAGQIWGSPAMAEALAELKELGVGWVALHPYAWIHRNGTVRFQPAAETGYLDRAVELARAAGVDLFWKPHLGYWGSFAWRGDIEFGDDKAAWQRFFTGYQAFIVDQARFAESHGIRLLAVGVETEATTHRESEWRQVIAAVRRVYHGQITYSANWNSLDRVPFWDAVDQIGVQGYFPISHDVDPDRGALVAGWDAPLAELHRLSQRHGKPVLFAEIGYNPSPYAASAPWETHSDGSPASRALRQRLTEVALERLEKESWISGLFWWKWMPGHHSRDFSMKDPEAQQALRHYWVKRPKEAR